MLKFGNTLSENEFTIADLPQRFLGMDFFKKNGLSIDAEKEEFFKRGDGLTICSVTADVAQSGPGGPSERPVQPSKSEVPGQEFFLSNFR